MSAALYNPVPAVVSSPRRGATAPQARPLGIPAGWKLRDRFAWLPTRLWKLDPKCYFTVCQPKVMMLRKYVEITFPSGVVRGIYGTCT